MDQTQDLNIEQITPLSSPKDLKKEVPVTEKISQTVVEGRKAIKSILRGDDARMLLIVGPCSIHDPKAASEYAEKLNALRIELEDHICIIMRVYFEKPRTTVGWKGLINDPHLDGSYDVQEGIRSARSLLSDLNEMGLPTATEFLDPIVPQYIADLVCWAAIGARTTESQTHREMSSGLSMPVGFKNNTDGSMQVALDAMVSAKTSHRFMGIDQEGRSAIIQSKGNPYGHLVLRGGKSRPNYDPESITEAEEKLKSKDYDPAILVDCSHANSGKKHENQEIVWRSIIAQKKEGRESLIGMMLESNLNEGNQKLSEDLSQLKYGVSVTDECVNFETTERLLRFAHSELGALSQAK